MRPAPTLALGIKLAFLTLMIAWRPIHHLDGGVRQHGASLLVVANGLRLLRERGAAETSAVIARVR